MHKIRWGILGTGFISSKFVECLHLLEDAEIVAVASRDLSKAKAFAGEHHIQKYFGNYAQMALVQDLDIVYIGTPHPSHLKDTLMFLDAGIPVLCEKPMGVNAKQTAAMIHKAKEKNVFLMEGMWTRFFPAVKKALEWVKDGRIGTPTMLFSNFGIDTSNNRDQWRFQREMAGGALLDVGIYPLSMAFAVFGTDPIEITTACHVDNGIDEYNTFSFKYGGGEIAVLGSSLSVRMENKVVINGTKGTIILGEGYDWWRANKVELLQGNEDIFSFTGEKEVFIEPYDAFGFQYEAKAVQHYLQMGLKEAPEITLRETLKIAETMDLLRKKWNVIYDVD